MWVSVGSAVEEGDNLLKPFVTEIPVLIKDTLADIGVKSADDGVVSSGMPYNGSVYLFRDGLGYTAAVTRTLWYELVHYGLRRFLTKEQSIAERAAA